jgi:16S rRNA pseudouridine516 synthase
LRRLDQLLASLGYGTRREVRRFVADGRVTIAGIAAAQHDAKVDPAQVLIDGEPLEAVDGLLAILHKPLGYTCTHSADDGPTIYQLLPSHWLTRNPTVSSVGRLDKDTSGLLLITDQGQLIQRFTSPRTHVEKLYEVTVDEAIPEAVTAIFASGELMLRSEDKPCLPAQLEITSPFTARLTLMEGRYHQVRRMFASQGLTVTALHRSRFGPFTLDSLAEGEWHMITPIPSLI